MLNSQQLYQFLRVTFPYINIIGMNDIGRSTNTETNFISASASEDELRNALESLAPVGKLHR